MLPRFTIGDTLTATETLAKYPATASWVLHYRLLPREGSGAAIAFNSTASGSDHLITVPAATTASWAAGTYTWASWVSDGANSYSLAHGTTELLPNPRIGAGPLDLRSSAQIGLDNVRALLRGKASSGVQYYTINGRQLGSYSLPDLIVLESHLAAEVRREVRGAALAAGKPDPSRYAVRLGRA